MAILTKAFVASMKMTIISKDIYSFNAILSNSNDILQRTRKAIAKMHVKARRTQIAKQFLSRKK